MSMMAMFKKTATKQDIDDRLDNRMNPPENHGQPSGATNKSGPSSSARVVTI